MKKLNKDLLKANVMNNINSDLKYCNIGGAAVMVAQEGELLLDERAGYANVMTGEPLKRKTLFRLASMTKPVTGVATLIGVERGWFSLEDKITKYYPEIGDMYVGRLENGRVVPDHKPKNDLLLYQFLTHNNGFMASSPLYLIQEDEMPKEAYKDNKTAVDYCIKNTCLAFEPKVTAGYSGYTAFDVIALLIEKNSGMKYADFIRTNIFEPLGIKDITYNPTEEQWGRMITMCDKITGKGYAAVDMGRHTFENFPLEYTCAGAGLAGTIEDYYVFAEMLRCGGEYNGVRILKPETLALMSKPYVSMEVMGSEAVNSWGLGVRVAVRDPYLPAGCYGWSGAYGTHFWIDPENDITAIYMKNSRWHDSHGGGLTAQQFEEAVIKSLE